MSNTRRKIPILPVALIVLIALVVLVVNVLGGDPEEKTKEEAVRAGIEYLEALEQKDPEAVKQIRKGYYEAELAAQRNVLVQQLSNGTMDPFSLFKDYVLMGDSRAVGFWYRDFLDKGRIIADGGHTIRNITMNMETLVSMNPGTIFLCYGLNDSSIGYWDTAGQYVGEYMQIVKEIRTRLPDATIVVSSILPARDPAFEQSSKWYNIPEWSAALEKACQENNVIFANCDQLAVDYPNLWDPDGIHFRKEFYPYWASCLAAALLMGGAA